jgi:membrane protein implicated in regulation of membrane protease activity
MDAHWLWWGLAVMVAIGEVASGSFYLLVLSAAALAGGLVALAGAALTAQMLVVAVVAITGWWLLRRWRGARPDRSLAGSAGVDSTFDVGQTVEVTQWQANGRARVRYRGADWDARLGAGVAAEAPGGIYRIRAIDGNCLVLEPA